MHERWRWSRRRCARCAAARSTIIVEYGFHRYAADAAWQKPHTEMLLCDQAILTMAYLEAYQATGRKEYARTARQIFTYALRDLRSPEGAFYSAQDVSARREDHRRLERHDDRSAREWRGRAGRRLLRPGCGARRRFDSGAAALKGRPALPSVWPGRVSRRLLVCRLGSAQSVRSDVRGALSRSSDRPRERRAATLSRRCGTLLSDRS